MKGFSMENYRMNSPCPRCGSSASRNCNQFRRNETSCPIRQPEKPCDCRTSHIYHHVDEMPLTMAYVPMQRFSETFPLCTALQAGTIFPELCKPFCGKGGRGC